MRLCVPLAYHEPPIPDGVAILRTDNATPNVGTMLYFEPALSLLTPNVDEWRTLPVNRH